MLKLPRYYDISFVLLVINLENYQQIGTKFNPTFYPECYMNGLLQILKSIAKRLKIEANDKENHLIKGIVDKTKSEPTHVSQTRENMTTCLRLFHLNIV